MTAHQTRRAAVAGSVLALLALGACSSAGSDSKATNPAARAPAGGSLNSAVVPAPDAALDLRESGDPGDRVKTTTVEVSSPDLVRTAKVTIVSKDLVAARDDLDALLSRYHGTVSDETTRNDDHGKPLRSTLVVRVASGDFEAVMAAFKDDPAVTSSSVQSEDVHQQVIDVASRLHNLRTSRVRLQHFLSTAGNLRSLLDFERRLTAVETDIERLTAQRDYLRTQTSLATIAIDMRVPGMAPPAPKDPLEHAGFVSGLGSGWAAFEDVVVVTLTGIGAAVPFAVLLALVGVPAWVLLRRRRHDVAVTATVKE